MTTLVILTVVDIVLLIAGLAFYLFWVGTLLTRIAGNLEECAEIVRTIVGHAKLIGPGVEHINQTGGVVAGALPLLYGMAEEIVDRRHPEPRAAGPARRRPGPHRGPGARACMTPWASPRTGSEPATRDGRWSAADGQCAGALRPGERPLVPAAAVTEPRRGATADPLVLP